MTVRRVGIVAKQGLVAAAGEVGLAHGATTASPITGQEGNVEFLLHLRPAD